MMIAAGERATRGATIEALKGALESDRSRIAELRAERDGLTARRPWWWRAGVSAL
jgi:hypothetical protein